MCTIQDDEKIQRIGVGDHGAEEEEGFVSRQEESVNHRLQEKTVANHLSTNF